MKVNSLGRRCSMNSGEKFIHADVLSDAEETPVVRVMGTCSYTRQSEFDNLTGYITGNYTSEWTDRDGTRWRTVTTIINLGRPDRGTLGDVDAQLRAEILSPEDEAQRAYQESIAQTREARHEEAKAKVVAYLQEHGPSTLAAILKVTKWKQKPSVKEHVIRYPDVYKCFQFLPEVWGLHGQTYNPPLEMQPVVIRVHDALLKHGPMTAAALSEVIKATQAPITKALREGATMFVKVGIEQTKTCPVGVWGLRGVHDV